MLIRPPLIYLIQRTFLIISIFIYAANLSAQQFADASSQSGINHKHLSKPGKNMGGGVAVLDFNNDGWEDIYLTGGYGRDHLYENDGAGNFTEIGVQAGLSLTTTPFTQGVISADVDNDGFSDLYVTTWDGYNILLRNNGDETFTNVITGSGMEDSIRSTSAAFGDYDNDGLLDLYVVNYLTGYRGPGLFDYICQGNKLYHNEGDFKFSDVSDLLSVSDTGCALAATFTDFDDDSDMDIFLANDFGAWVRPNQLFENDFPNPFNNVSISSGVNDSIFGMGIANGDYDNDGDLDYYVTNIDRNILYNNQGDGTFIHKEEFAGVKNDSINGLSTTGWGTAFLDFDKDGLLDLFVSNGWIMTTTGPLDPDVLYRNLDGNIFEEYQKLSTDTCRGAAFGDFDNDGDLDIISVVTSLGTDSVGFSNGRTQLYLNNSSDSLHWIKLKLQGLISNSSAVGTRLILYADTLRLTREIDGGNSHLSSNTKIVHFGLDTITYIDSIVIKWPSGVKSKLSGLTVDSMLNIAEDTASGISKINKEYLSFVFPNPFNESLNIIIDKPEELKRIEIYDLSGKQMFLNNNIYGKNRVKWTPPSSCESTLFLIKLNYANEVKILKSIYLAR